MYSNFFQNLRIIVNFILIDLFAVLLERKPAI